MEKRKYWTKTELGTWHLTDVRPSVTLDDLIHQYSRKCNICGKELLYQFKDRYEFELKNSIPCQSCRQRKETPSRKCPKCGTELHYINKYVYLNALKKNSLCNSCAKIKKIT